MPYSFRAASKDSLTARPGIRKTCCGSDEPSIGERPRSRSLEHKRCLMVDNSSERVGTRHFYRNPTGKRSHASKQEFARWRGAAASSGQKRTMVKPLQGAAKAARTFVCPRREMERNGFCELMATLRQKPPFACRSRRKHSPPSAIDEPTLLTIFALRSTSSSTVLHPIGDRGWQ
jgi:hypothetical protein